MTQRVPILDLNPQHSVLHQEFLAAFERVMTQGAFIMGPDVKAFEAEAAAYLGTKHAIGVNSGTDALVIALKAAGVGEGDEVITTPFTFFATAESISNVGAKPVFVDVELGSMNLDPGALAAALSPRTKAIMPVHIFGRPADMDAVMTFAEAHALKVIEDCAQSFGATYDAGAGGKPWSGKQTGTMGLAGAYSFFPSKNLGGFGDGGLLATDDDEVARVARMLRAHGAEKKYHNEILGYNSRLDTLQAALLRVKLPHIDTWNQGRRRVAKAYAEALAGVPGITTPEVSPGHVFHQYTIRVAGGQRDAVAEALKAQGIDTMVYYPIPQDQLPVYRGQYPAFPNSARLASEVLSLPIWPDLDGATLARVAEGIRSAVVAGVAR